MNLDCGAVVSIGGNPYMIAHGTYTSDALCHRKYVLINLYTGWRWSDSEFDLPITLEELGKKYRLEIKFEGHLSG